VKGSLCYIIVLQLYSSVRHCCIVQFGPSLLPRELMLKLGSDVVATTTGRVQQHAATLILETARCASGTESASTAAAGAVPVRAGAESGREPGCATAGLDEVNVLLGCLQSPSVALREVAIQVSNVNTALRSG